MNNAVVLVASILSMIVVASGLLGMKWRHQAMLATLKQIREVEKACIVHAGVAATHADRSAKAATAAAEALAAVRRIRGWANDGGRK